MKKGKLKQQREMLKAKLFYWAFIIIYARLHKIKQNMLKQNRKMKKINISTHIEIE